MLTATTLTDAHPQPTDRPCRTPACSALARAGSDYCAVHDRYHRATTVLKCQRCSQAIRVGEYYTPSPDARFVAGVHAKRCEGPRGVAP